MSRTPTAVLSTTPFFPVSGIGSRGDGYDNALAQTINGRGRLRLSTRDGFAALSGGLGLMREGPAGTSVGPVCGSIQLDVCRADHLLPLAVLVQEELTHSGGVTADRDDAPIGESSLDLIHRCDLRHRALKDLDHCCG